MGLISRTSEGTYNCVYLWFLGFQSCKKLAVSFMTESHEYDDDTGTGWL